MNGSMDFAGEEPSIMATGTPNSRCSFRAKKKAVAANDAVTEGDETSHRRLLSPFRLTWQKRMPGKSAAASSSLAKGHFEATLLMGYHMLDWPLAYHTSPTRTSLIRTSSRPPRMINSVPLSEAAMGFSEMRQSPLTSALPVTVCPANLTVTSCPGSARPQTGTAACCCNTM